VVYNPAPCHRVPPTLSLSLISHILGTSNIASPPALSFLMSIFFIFSFLSSLPLLSCSSLASKLELKFTDLIAPASSLAKGRGLDSKLGKIRKIRGFMTRREAQIIATLTSIVDQTTT
jgi:hypothetical protein